MEIDNLTNLLTKKVFEKANKTSNVYDTYVINIGIKKMMSINDCCGHELGDELIVAYSEYLKSIIEYNNLFRVGGNEWNLIVPLNKLNDFISELSNQDIFTAMTFSDGKLNGFNERLTTYQKQSIKRKTGALYINKIFLIGKD